MATSRILFLPDDPTTWTAEGMRVHLRTGKMRDTFYKEIFGWSDTELQEAVQRANDALERANIKPTETLSPIRFQKDTQTWTQGALKRLEAEADLVERSIKTDRLFCLPHQKNDWLKPLWFRRDMTFGGRAAETVYDFPTITQKFFQYARECRKGSLKRETGDEMDMADVEASTFGTPSSPAFNKKRGTPPLSRNGKTARTSLDGERSPHGGADEVKHGENPARPRSQLDTTDVHVGWVLQQDDGSFVLEKDFRSLRTWLVGTERFGYDYKLIHESLGMAQDRQLDLYWFDDLAGEPWVIKSDYAVAGAIERMHSKGEICFLLARNIEHVRALTPSQRRIESQTVQTLTLKPDRSFDQTDQTHRDAPRRRSDRSGPRPVQSPYMIPGISVSLARILGEQVMRSRVEYEE